MKEFYKGLKDGIPIALGYFAVSFSFGILALKGGLTVFQSVFISLTNVTSAGQFAGLQLIIAERLHSDICWDLSFCRYLAGPLAHWLEPVPVTCFQRQLPVH